MKSERFLKLDGYLFSLELSSDVVEDMFYQWLEENELYYGGILYEKEKDIEE